MDHLSKEEIEQIIVSNKGLVYTCMKELNLSNDHDAESAGFEALYNSILNYDSTKSKAKFSSYAYRAIFNRVNGVHSSRGTLINKNTSMIGSVNDGDEYDNNYFDSIFRSYYDLEHNAVTKDLLDQVLAYLENYIDMLKPGLPKIILSNWYYLHNCDIPLTELCEECGCSHAYCRKVLKTFRERLNKAFKGDMKW